jgi:hypothetical protein
MRRGGGYMIKEQIALYSEMRNINNSWVRIMPEGSILSIKKKTGEYRRWNIDYACLTMNIIPERFLTQVSQIGISGQLNLLKSKIVIPEIDSLTSRVAKDLAQKGVGTIIGVDDSYNYKERLLNDIKSSYEGCYFELYNTELREQNINEIIPLDTTLVIDVSDNIQQKYVLQSFCRERRIPFLCVIMAGNLAVMISVFRDTKDITGLLKGFSEKNNEILLPGREDILREYLIIEAMKILVYGNTDFRSKAICFDFKQARVYQIGF